MNEALGLTENGVSQNLVGAEKLGKSALSGFAAGLTTAALRGGRISATQVATDAFGNALVATRIACKKSCFTSTVSRDYSANY